MLREIGAIGVLGVASSIGVGGVGSWELIAATGDAVPGLPVGETSVFTRLNGSGVSPAISASGRVLFRADVLGYSGLPPSGYWVTDRDASPGSIEHLAYSADIAAIDRHDRIVVADRPVSNAFRDMLYGGFGGLAPLLNRGDAVPGSERGLFVAGFQRPSMSHSGLAAFTVHTTDGDSLNGDAVYASDGGGAPRVVFSIEHDIPELAGISLERIEVSDRVSVSADGRTMYFGARLDASQPGVSEETGWLFFRVRDGDLELIHRSGSSGGLLGLLQEPIGPIAVGKNGHGAFLAHLDGGGPGCFGIDEQGVYTVFGGATAIIGVCDDGDVLAIRGSRVFRENRAGFEILLDAEDGALAAPGARIASIGDESYTGNGLGQFVVTAYLTGEGIGTDNNAALYLWSPQSEASVLLREGQAFDVRGESKTIARWLVGGFSGQFAPFESGFGDGLSRDGLLAVGLVFTDGEQAVVTFRVPSGGTALPILLCGMGLVWRRRAGAIPPARP